jgi:archaellum biogenesis protein FlaJ (TadC family)
MINPEWQKWMWEHGRNCEICKRTSKEIRNDYLSIFYLALIFAVFFASVLTILLGDPSKFFALLFYCYLAFFVLFFIAVNVIYILMGKDPHESNKPKFWIKKSVYLTLNPEKKGVD